MENINLILDSQREFFKSKKIFSIDFRINNLKKLKNILIENEDIILESLKNDLNKSFFEGYSTELGLVLNDINFAIKNLRKWAKPKKVKTNIINFKSKSYIINEPFGNSLIISPWNYPVFLTILPLIGSISAGNTNIIKLSRTSSHTSKTLENLINNNFPSEYLYATTGESGTSQYLLEQRFDYIFYTGGIEFGKIVMEKASKNLTPVTLELGGKSPCIVDSDVDLDITAKRIVWGKFTNSGQTCVAPDYIFVNESIKDKLIEKIIYYIENMTLINREDYPNIINEKHFHRLLDYIKELDIIYNGGSDKDNLKIFPHLINNPSWETSLMKEEIFGPLLPIHSYKNIEDAIDKINSREKPLALYVFSNNKNFINKILNNISFGGGCVNDTLMHLSNPYLPFGGVGYSGMGNYHGKQSFETFSHKKSILDKSVLIDIPLRYPPYKEKINLIKKILK